MSVPYFPLYPTDFEAKTSHLNLEEDGAYNRLLRLSWMMPGCSLPDDPAWIARRMRVDMATFERVVAPILAEFFKRGNGRVWSARLTEEWKKADVTYRARSEAGKKGGRPKVVDNKAKEQKPGFDFDKAGPKQPEPEQEREEREPNGSPKKSTRGSRIQPDWQLPKSWGDESVEKGLPVEIVKREAERFKNYWLGVPGQKGIKLDWQATWRNWIDKRIDEALPKSAPQTDFWTGKALV